MINNIEGIQIYTNSLFNTLIPHSLKKLWTLTGDTCTGCQGKKYRVSLIGEKKATPSPPFVIASSMPCETVAIKKNNTSENQCFENTFSALKNNEVITSEKMKANEIECMKPLCPQNELYGIPK